MPDSPPRRLVVATSNPHKIEEISAVLAPRGFEVLGLVEAGGGSLPEPEETGATFEENARIKAVAYAQALGVPCLADDSGLEVDALGGEPGVRSARWSGAEGDRATRDAANNRKLVERIASVPEHARTARFVCAMCLASPEGAVLAESRGVFEGVIVETPRGTNGFGYDPHLLLPDEGRTSAELAPEEKNARSHRGAATRAIAERLLAGRRGG
ncbi:MAG: RdgB/HAM1 family non-canonical purine NTP pyrophosphatase [Phycisphaerales bacterium]